MAESIRFITPCGEAYRPSLNRTETFLGKDTGKFTCKLVLTGAALEEMKTKINDAMVDAYGPKKAAQVWAENSPIKTTKEGDKSYIKFSANAVTTEGKPNRILRYDSRGALITLPLNIGSGSIVRINGSMTVFPAKEPGAAFYMKSIQVIKYVECVSGCGFPPVPGGFTI